MNLELRKAEAVVQAILADRQPLEVETLISNDERRTISVAEHEEWRESAFPPPPGAVDPIDELLGELRHAQPLESKPNRKISRR